MEPNSTAQPVSFSNKDASIAVEAGVYNNLGNTTVKYARALSDVDNSICASIRSS